MADYVIKMGQVESIEDNLDGGRIKVRLTEDQDTPLSKLPYAFPLNPKIIQCVPKVGETALIITSQIGNANSQRYYIGPVISQMQEIEKAPYNYGMATSTSLQQGAILTPMKDLSQFSVTDGAFPDKNDIALIGRKGEDIILRDGEIDLRCGVRKEALGDEDKDLKGNVLFNYENPAYIQLKYKDGLMAAGDGAINLVADRINLVSHKDTDNNIQVNLTNPSSKKDGKTDPLLKDADVETLMSQLHQLPYGDILVEILRKMCNAITEHTHAMNGLPPCEGFNIKEVKGIDLNSVLSHHVRIS